MRVAERNELQSRSELESAGDSVETLSVIVRGVEPEKASCRTPSAASPWLSGPRHAGAVFSIVPQYLRCTLAYTYQYSYDGRELCAPLAAGGNTPSRSLPLPEGRPGSTQSRPVYWLRTHPAPVACNVPEAQRAACLQARLLPGVDATVTSYLFRRCSRIVFLSAVVALQTARPLPCDLRAQRSLAAPGASRTHLHPGLVPHRGPLRSLAASHSHEGRVRGRLTRHQPRLVRGRMPASNPSPPPDQPERLPGRPPPYLLGFSR